MEKLSSIEKFRKLWLTCLVINTLLSVFWTFWGDFSAYSTPLVSYELHILQFFSILVSVFWVWLAYRCSYKKPGGKLLIWIFLSCIFTLFKRQFIDCFFAFVEGGLLKIFLEVVNTIWISVWGILCLKMYSINKKLRNKQDVVLPTLPK